MPDFEDHITERPRLSGRGFRVLCVDYPPDCRLEPHAHEAIGISLVIDGCIRERAHDTEEEASTLSVVFKPSGTIHENVAGPRGARTISVELLDASELVEDPSRLGSWRWSHAGPGVRPLLALGRMLRESHTDADPEEIVLELLAEMGDIPAPQSGDAPYWVRQAREALDDLAPDGIRVRALAEQLRVHPASLTRAFHRAYGVPVTVYRRRVRLRVAAAQVAGTESRLGEIAHSSGYSDQAHMSREIRATTGLTPSALRELVGG